jgi:AcrR family transcriptional regulator
MRNPRRKSRKVRPRNAAATRESILVSALRAFAERGYDGVGLREIAQGAGVTAMLVHHYFGSKEQLFSEVVARKVATPIILSQENIASGKPGEALATALIKMTNADQKPEDGFLVFLHSASTRRAAEITRQQIEQHQYKSVASVVRGAHAAERAALVLAIVAGVQIMRQMIGLSPLAKAEPKSLVKVLAPILQELIGSGR